MTIRVAINGYGRIGRNILRAHYEDGKKHGIEIVAINDLGNPETNAHLTRFDTAHGRAAFGLDGLQAVRRALDLAQVALDLASTTHDLRWPDGRSYDLSAPI